MGMKCKARCWMFIPLAIVGIAALGYVVMLLWSWLLPSLFPGVHEIGYWQALGVLVLSKILFGGLRGHGCHGGWHRHRWESMTAEERERFQAGMSRCCGKGACDTSESKKAQ